MSSKKSYKSKKRKAGNVPKKTGIEQFINKNEGHFFKKYVENNKWSYVIIFLLTFLLYGNTLTLEYALDDRLMITENEFTLKGIAGIKDILTHDSFVGFFGERKNLLSGGRYRPLSQVMFAVEYELFGLNPFIGHLINVLLYALSCMILLKVLKILFKKASGLYRYIPYLATLLFLAHPLHTEVVANVKGRDDIMSFLGSIIVLLLVLNYVKTKKISYLWAIGCVFFLTLMSKENAITFLAIVPLTLFFFIKPRFKYYVTSMIPLVLSSALFIIIRAAVLGFELNIGEETELLNNPYVHATAGEKYATIFYTMGIYLRLLIFPHPLTHDYYPFHIEIINWSSPKAFIPLIIYVCLGIYAIWGLLKRKMPAYGIAFYLITFSIASNLVFNIGTFMNERFMYVPLLGFCIVLAYLIVLVSSRLAKNPRKVKNLIFTFSLIIFLLYAPKTISRNFVWKDDYTLFTTDVKISKNSAKCNVSAGGFILEEAIEIDDERLKNDKLQEALKYLSRGLEIHPHYVAAWVLYGNAHFHSQNFEEAKMCYVNALEISPNNQDALNNLRHLAVYVQSHEKYDFSLSVFETIQQYSELDSDDKLQKAVAVAEEFPLEEMTLRILYEILEEDSLHFGAISRLGEIYGRVYNDLEKSLYYLHKAHRINPKDASNLENMGIAYGMTGDFKNSLIYFEKALKHNPESAKLLSNISQTYELMGETEKAETYLNKALMLQ